MIDTTTDTKTTRISLGDLMTSEATTASRNLAVRTGLRAGSGTGDSPSANGRYSGRFANT